MHRRLPLLVLFAVAAAIVGVGLATASTSVAWKATFSENFGGRNHSPFVCPADTNCSGGQVVGLGQAQEVIVFGGGCGGTCDRRTLTFADGSTIVMDETDVPDSARTPGKSGNAPGQPGSYGNPFRLDRTDVVVDGTGRFAGASGSATCQVKVAGGVATINLTGTVTF